MLTECSFSSVCGAVAKAVMPVQDYTQALGMCLMTLQQNDSSSSSSSSISAHNRLRTLVIEWAQLMVSLVVSVPDRMKELGNGTMFEEPEEPAKYYSNLVASILRLVPLASHWLHETCVVCQSHTVWARCLRRYSTISSFASMSCFVSCCLSLLLCMASLQITQDCQVGVLQGSSLMLLCLDIKHWQHTLLL